MPVQEKAVPYLLDGRDMIVQSRTGSGKTGGFLLPLFNLLDEDLKAAQALVLSPTRELARQIHEEFDKLRGNHPFTSVLIYGGVKYEPQIKALKNGAQVIIGTPGRILDHIQQGRLVLDDLKMLVFDEADEMLSMGYDKPILAGLSRKSMLYKTLDISAQEALNATTSANTIALLNGANILRVHDVKEAVEAVTLVNQLGAT